MLGSAFVLSLLLTARGLWADGDPTMAADSVHVAKLIAELGSDVFGEREAAVKALRTIGYPARAQLFEARNHPSAEVRARVAVLVRQLDADSPLNNAFQAFAKQPDEKVDIEEGMWLISRILNKDVQRVPLARQLDSLADAVKIKLGKEVSAKSVDPERLITALREVLFEDEKFGGNFDDYNNPANSSLEKVLESKKGLPILLSHVVIAVGRRLEVPIVGVPAYGRYIVKYDGRRAPMGFPQRDVFINPFDNGKILTREDRMALFPSHDPDLMIPPQSHRRDLIRMLSNMESHLFIRDDNDRAYLALEFRAVLEQNDPMGAKP